MGSQEEPRSFRPSLLLGVGTLVALFFASQYYIAALHFGRPVPFWRALLPQLVCWYLWAAAAPFVFYLARRFPIERGALVRSIVLHVSVGASLSAGHLVLEAVLFRFLGMVRQPLPFPSVVRSLFVGEFHADLIAYGMLLAVGHGVVAYRRNRDRDLASSRLEAKLAQAELDVLRMQLHPHFLFNTLHAISSLMHKDVESADRMMCRLGDLLRISLDSAGKQEVSLKKELDFLERYLEIQQARFQDRLQVGLSIEPSTLDARVPHLILQPLVENAVRHGIAPRSGSGRIDVVSRRVNGNLELQVRDTGVGPPGGLGGLKEGLGLTNTRARLAHLYGAGHSFEICNGNEGGLAVTLAIPFRITSGEEDSDGNPASHFEDSGSDRR